jgi:hypothetical protein
MYVYLHKERGNSEFKGALLSPACFRKLIFVMQPYFDLKINRIRNKSKTKKEYKKD